MIRRIKVDAQTHIWHDLGVTNDYGVKIRTNGNRNPVVLQKGVDDSAPMCAKEFLDRVKRYEEEKKDMHIVVEENIDPDKQKAWIWDCDEDCDYAESVNCSIDDPNKTVLLFFD